MKPFTYTFWLLYLCGGISDFIDGFIARITKQESDMGAKLDSIADLVFLLSLCIVAIKNIEFPLWIWIFIGIITMIRCISYIVGFQKYHTFSSIHTYMNKATGAMIFVFPILYVILGINLSSCLLCFFALYSSLEEMFIIIKSKKLNRDCKSFLDY